MKKRFLMVAAVCFASFCLPFFGQAVTKERAAALAQQFLPAEVLQRYQRHDQLERLQDPLKEINDSWGNIRYLTFAMTGDTNQYLLLGWGNGRSSDDLYWRLLKSLDGGATWTIAQDSGRWYSPLGYAWSWRLSNLTGDTYPQLVVDTGGIGNHGGEASFIFAWRNGGFVPIFPQRSDSSGLSDDYFTAFCSNQVHLEDVDGDGKAEVVVSPSLEMVKDSVGNVDWVPKTPTQIFRYDGTNYVLWKEIPADDPYPTTVPSIAVVQPSTLPLSSLSNPGNGKLRVFVSHPAGTNTVDDMDTAQFRYSQTVLPFKKRWTNNKQPDTTSANWEWAGCPVKQAPKQGQGDWSVSPEDPTVPSPDGALEYHFVAPYLELELSRGAVYPYLLQAATDAFTKDPNRQTYFVEVPISGKMKNGKLAAVSALVCIKKTGSEKEAQESPTSPLHGEQGSITAPAAQQESTSPAKR